MLTFMKKLFLVATVAVSIVGCKKDETPKPNQPQNLSMAEQVANVIRKADAKLYKKVYGANPDVKGPKDVVTYLPGVFYIPRAGIDDATCLGTNGVCIVIVTSPKSVNGSVSEITGNVDETFEAGSAQLILNNGDAPGVQPISSLKVTMDNGVNVSYN